MMTTVSTDQGVLVVYRYDININYLENKQNLQTQHHFFPSFLAPLCVSVRVFVFSGWRLYLIECR